MERLDVQKSPERANIEAAIHFARYAIGKGLAREKRILDIACGEGYGSYLLKQAGALSVVGVDVSAESVARAQKSFGSDGLRFVSAKAEDLPSVFADGEFDLVVSVETIEHLENPTEFLKNLKRLVSKDGVIVLSCPNDHWYYPESDRSNPYHRRKYQFKEFQELCTFVLGDDVRWSIGTAVFGFGSTPVSSVDVYKRIPDSWMSYHDVGSAYLVNGEASISATAEKCSYFVGVWNAPEYEPGVAVFPLSMDEYAVMATARSEVERLNSALALTTQEQNFVRCELQALLDRDCTLTDADVQARTLLVELGDSLRGAQRAQRRLGLKLSASQAEKEAILSAMLICQTEQARLEEECRQYRIGHERYVRLRRLLPQGLRSWIVRTIRSFRGRGANR